MPPEKMFDLIRPLVAEIDGAAVLRNVTGGYGGFLGYDVAELVDTSVFDHLTPEAAHRLTNYFVDTIETEPDTVSTPLPFRVGLIGADGTVHPVDIIPTARETEDGIYSWIVVIVPVALMTSPSRSLDAEMSGVPREDVKVILSEELAVDGGEFESRWFLVDLTGRVEGPVEGTAEVTTSRADDRPIADVIARSVLDGWQPWSTVEPHGALPIPVEDLPDELAAEVTARGWSRVFTAPVHLDDEICAAYLHLGSAPPAYELDAIKTNVMDRVAKLVDVTMLLFRRWRDSDRLHDAAMRDELTGLANRLRLKQELDEASPRTAVLYVDIDNFKTINDQFGHDAGDQVLIEVAKRITAACRPGDVVSRVGGDEFVVLLHRADVRTGAVVAERIQSSVATSFVVDGLPGVTVSIGVADLERDASNPLGKADQAMLEAKRTGRNRLVTH